MDADARLRARNRIQNLGLRDTVAPTAHRRSDSRRLPLVKRYMESFLIAVVSMAVVLGIMILVHEFGHYAAAKWFGVRVDVFSIGFGKRLCGLPPRRYRLSHQRPAARRLRKDGGRESAGVAQRRA